jgi:hypothetical protein
MKRIQPQNGGSMTIDKTKAKQPEPAGSVTTTPSVDDAMVNDSLGTIDVSDSTGSDSEKETGDAKRKNKDTGRED